jgi:Ser/Thr protein kinase RdoA (MazF antagonist)
MIALERLLGPPARVERSKWRLSLYQKRVVRADGERYVLYRFLNPRAAGRLLWLLSECEQHAVPLQRPAAWTRSTWDAVKLGGFWVATRFVPGEPILGLASPPTLVALGTALARLHGIERERPGALFRMHLPWRTWHQRFQGQLAGGLSVGLGAAERETVGNHLSWLTAKGAFLSRLERYQLVHGDLYGANVLAAGDAVSLIDYEAVSFEPAGLELASALLRDFCGGSLQLRMTLLDAYLQNCSSQVRGLWQTHCDFYLAAAALRLAWRRDLRARRLTRLRRDGDYARLQALRYARWARRLIEAGRAGAENARALLRQIEGAA